MEDSAVDPNYSHRAMALKEKRQHVSVFSKGSDLLSSSSHANDSQEPPKKRSSIAEKHDGHFRPNVSKAFQRSMELAKKETFSLIDSQETKYARQFTKRSGFKVYKMNICQTPNCDCPYASSTNICKHVLFVLLHFFKLQERDYRLHQKALTKSEVQDLFSQLDLKSSGEKSPTSTSVAGIFNAHSATKQKQVWEVRQMQSQPGRRPKCASPKCQKQFSEGDLCISVDALYIPPHETADGRKFAVSRTFRFCPDKKCISTQPLQSNLVVPPMSVTINKSINVTPEESQQLIDEDIV